MLDLTVSEELILPVPIERAREACERAITQLDWNIREQSPTTLLAREKGILGYDWLGTKTLTAPADLQFEPAFVEWGRHFHWRFVDDLVAGETGRDGRE